MRDIALIGPLKLRSVIHTLKYVVVHIRFCALLLKPSLAYTIYLPVVSGTQDAVAGIEAKHKTIEKQGYRWHGTRKLKIIVKRPLRHLTLATLLAECPRFVPTVIPMVTDLLL